MEIIKTTFSEVTDLVTNILSEQKEACVYCISDENCVIVGSNGGVNKTEALNRGIRLVEIKHEGGTIIASPGDVQIGIFTHGYTGNNYRQQIISNILDKLKQNGHNAILDKNDILVNDKKCVGFGSRMFGDILYTAIQISVNIDIDLIKTICTKKMSKVPDGLSNYGIITEDILDILFNAIPH